MNEAEAFTFTKTYTNSNEAAFFLFFMQLAAKAITPIGSRLTTKYI